MTLINIQLGHIARHTPKGAGAQGREAAVIDVAQDLLLQRLHEMAVLDSVAIKGGTAIRKLYAGKEGRFSLDLDFSAASLDSDHEKIALAFVTATDGLTIGPFTYGMTERRGKWSVTISSRFTPDPTLSMKLDFSLAPWLDPVTKEWIPMLIHNQYGAPLPRINAVSLEENIAEKIARLNRTTMARDMYDLAWIAKTPTIFRTLDTTLIRRLAVLKIWVDTNGIHTGTMSWNPGHEGSVFDTMHWLRERDKSEFDLEDIGALAVPMPTVKDLSCVVRTSFAFLDELDEEERMLAQSDERDRSLAIRLLKNLPGNRLKDIGLY